MEQLETPRGSAGSQPWVRGWCVCWGGGAPRSGARAFASRCLPPPGNPPASRLAPLASEKGAAGTGPMGVGDSAGCGCQGLGPTSSILSSPSAATRGLDSDATGRADMEAARCAPGPRANRSGAGARATERRGGVSRLGGRGPGPGSGLQVVQALSIPRRQHSLVPLSSSLPRTSLPCSPRVSDFLTLSAFALYRVSLE